MWKLNLLFYILDFSLISFSDKYTIKLWFLKKEKKREKWNPNEWCIFICEMFIFFSSSICIHQHYINEMINLKNEVIGMRMTYEIKWKKMEMNLTSFSCVFLLCFLHVHFSLPIMNIIIFHNQCCARNGWCSQIPLPNHIVPI